MSQDRILLVRGQPTPLFEQESCNGQADWPRAVQSLLTRTHLTGSPVRVLLNGTLFQQIQIERPDVPDEELNGALPWAVKDFVTEPVMQLSCDYSNCQPIRRRGPAWRWSACRRRGCN